MNYPALGGIPWGPLISNVTKSDYLTALNLFLTCKQYLFGYVPFWQFCGIIRVSLSAFLAQNEQAFNKCNCCYLVILLVGFPVGTSGKETACQWRRLLWKCCFFNAKSNSRIYILLFQVDHDESWLTLVNFANTLLLVTCVSYKFRFLVCVSLSIFLEVKKM